MTDETKVEQSAEELSKEQSSKQNSEGTDNGTPTIEKLAETIQGLQKGYTVTRQEFAEVRENLQNIADSLNTKSGAEQGTDEYVTVGKLKEVLTEYDNSKSQVQEARIKEAGKEIDRITAELEADGIITSQKDRDDILEFAVKEGILDLNRAAAKWIKSQGSDKAKEIAKAKVRQEEGSKVGTSSTNAGEESKGLDYQKVQEMRREYGF